MPSIKFEVRRERLSFRGRMKNLILAIFNLRCQLDSQIKMLISNSWCINSSLERSVLQPEIWVTSAGQGATVWRPGQSTRLRLPERSKMVSPDVGEMSGWGPGTRLGHQWFAPFFSSSSCRLGLLGASAGSWGPGEWQRAQDSFCEFRVRVLV